ncbi:MAG TPA: response regulator [Acidimicrobiia bacterium]|nr:response regulator [Acidimicrobiia bacterium]
MPTILVASDSAPVRDAVRSALVRPGFSVVQAERGQDVVPFVAETPPDLIVLDMQIGNMGGVATAIELHNEHSADRCADVPMVLLLDREADRFLAHRAEVDGVIVKPFDPGTLRRAVTKVLADRATPTLSVE